MKLKEIINKPYKYQFKNNKYFTNIKGGLNFIIINTIVKKNIELNFIFYFRKLSLIKLIKLKQPDWVFFEVPDINYDKLLYYSAFLKLNKVKKKKLLNNTLINLKLYKKNKNKFIAIDFVFDSISIGSTIYNFLKKQGILYMPLFKSIKLYPNLINRYLSTIVSINNNFFSALNSTVFSEGSFCFIPKNTYCSFDLATYFRTNTKNIAQFERTLIIIGENSNISYLEGCTAPLYKDSQLHVAVIEIFVKYNSKIKYFTVQNWFKGTELGEGGLYNLTTKRGLCLTNSILEWTQLEMGSAITWKYPSTILIGNYSYSEFFSSSFLSGLQESDTGSKMIHLSSYTISKIISKNISLNYSINSYRGLVEISSKAKGSKSYTECHSLLVNNKSLTITFPYLKINTYLSYIQQEAIISKIKIKHLFFFQQRGITLKVSYTLLISGFCENICSRLPREFSIEIPYLIVLRSEEALS